MDIQAKAEMMHEAAQGGASVSDFVQMLADVVAATRERCAQLCEAEHVGVSLNDGKLCDADFSYNNALKDAACAIRVA